MTLSLTDWLTKKESWKLFSENLKIFWKFQIFQKSKIFPKIFVENLDTDVVNVIQKLVPTIPCKHSEIRMTLLMWPWSVKIAGKDLRMGPQTAIDSSNIPLWLFGNNEDFIDVPLACKDSLYVPSDLSGNVAEQNVAL